MEVAAIAHERYGCSLDQIGPVTSTYDANAQFVQRWAQI